MSQYMILLHINTIQKTEAGYCSLKGLLKLLIRNH